MFSNEKIYALLFVCIVAFSFFSNKAYAAIIDEVELNDTSNDAQLIERNNHNPAQMLVGDNSSQKVLAENIVSNLDVDWYKVTLPGDPKTILSINSSIEPNFTFEVYNSEFFRIFEKDYYKDPSFLGSFPYEFNIPTTEEYYI